MAATGANPLNIPDIVCTVFDTIDASTVPGRATLAKASRVSRMWRRAALTQLWSYIDSLAISKLLVDTELYEVCLRRLLMIQL